MPSVSRPQQRLMRAAAAGATFPKAKQIRESMSPSTLREFTKLASPRERDYAKVTRRG